MAESTNSLNGNETSYKQYAMPSNEEIITELTKELGSASIESAEKKCENSNKCEYGALNQDVNNLDSTVEENVHNHVPEDFDNELETEENVTVEDDFIDEETLKDLEVTYSAEDRERLRGEAEACKTKGNDQFKAGNYQESAVYYTSGLRTCPLAFAKDRAILYSNRAAAKMKLDLKPSAIDDCTKAIELDPEYLKAYFRRAQMYEETEKLDEALADYQKVLELDPLHREALYASKRLPEQINERNEKMKTEMLGKLKDLGNMILRPFGLSTENFQLTQNPNTGGYSVNFQQAPR